MTQDLRPDEAYEMAKGGAWDKLLLAWSEDPLFAMECAHYVKTSSHWTFLHQAAYFGNEPACRKLIQYGARVDAVAHDKMMPADVARSRGHILVAELLCEAAQDIGSLWSAPNDASLLPSSPRWHEAIERRATQDMFVAYGGGRVHIQSGDCYFVDSFERILVGWHGTYDPPLGMDAEPMIGG